jgi:hypothetical protein
MIASGEAGFVEALKNQAWVRFCAYSLAGMGPDEAMLAAVKGAREQGIRTGLMSNSMGDGRYDRGAFPTCSAVS